MTESSETIRPGLRAVANDRRDAEAAARAAAELLPADGARAARATITGWEGYAPSPLTALPGVAREAGVGAVLLKDESGRFGLSSFKALGGAYAVVRATAPARERGEPVTVTCTTDGNHGRAVAWGARLVGCDCVIYMHADVSADREAAVRALGAEVVRTPGNYDESFRQNAEDAARNGWLVVSDTSPDPLAPAPRDVMQGYRILVDEVAEQVAAGAGAWPTHVLVQAGCGGFAGAIAAQLLALAPQRPLPRFVLVEPERAACLYESVRAGAPRVVAGALETAMGGLSVGEVSGPAWEILSRFAAAAIAIDDSRVEPCMRRLAEGRDGDPVVVAGETGVAGLAGLLAAAAEPSARELLGLTEESVVLLVNTEGDTAPEIYERIVGRSAAAVRDAAAVADAA